MSLTVMRKCPILGCKFNIHPIRADSIQIKRHLKFDHDYRQKQDTAISLGIIYSDYDKHSPTWLVNSLSDISRV